MSLTYIQVLCTSSGYRGDPLEPPYRGPMASDSYSDYQLSRSSPRKVILVSSSESDIPVAGKGWRAYSSQYSEERADDAQTSLQGDLFKTTSAIYQNARA